MQEMIPLFLDSGAHGLYARAVLRKGKQGTHSAEGAYEYYETDEFWAYVDTFAAFVKAKGTEIDLYANVDVIFNPELTWKVQEYLEKEHGLQPLPVIHFGAPLHWIEKYLDKGYDYIAFGGLGQEVKEAMYIAWADRAFEVICSGSDHLPRCKVHGFAVTSFHLMQRYPFYSADSTSWLKHGAYGFILIPSVRVNGQLSYASVPRRLCVSMKNWRQHVQGDMHFDALHPAAKEEVKTFVKAAGFDIDYLIEHYTARTNYNALYFQRFVASLPPWPWAFEAKIKKGLLF